MAASWYVIDFRHDPRFEADAGRLPSQALRLWDYFGAILESATATWGGLHPRITAVPCRRRPNRRPCGGFLAVAPREDDLLEWACPRCEDGGVFSAWRDTPGDLSDVPVPGEHDASPDTWRAAIVTPDEYRHLVGSDVLIPPVARRILRAALATRPGIRIEAPVAAWDDLLEVAQALVEGARRRPVRRLLEAARERLTDATNAWT